MISTGDLAAFVCNVALAIVARSFTCVEGSTLVVACIEVRSMDTPGQANHGPLLVRRSKGEGVSRERNHVPGQLIVAGRDSTVKSMPKVAATYPELFS